MAVKRTLAVLTLFAVLAGGLVSSTHAGPVTTGPILLFDGKDLTGWQPFVAPSKGVTPDQVWTVRDRMIVCKGQVPGYLRTAGEYGDYVLRLEWRWGESVTSGRNSGVFVHVSGPDKIWPKGAEAQLASGNAGDFWLVDGYKLNVDAARQGPKQARHYSRMEGKDIEKPVGEWNRYEITCRGNEIELRINDRLVNRGTGAESVKGSIILQSEGAEIHFRNITLEPLK